MLYAQLRDNSQGVIKITTGAAARDPAASAVETEHETKLSGELMRALAAPLLTPPQRSCTAG